VYDDGAAQTKLAARVIELELDLGKTRLVLVRLPPLHYSAALRLTARACG
jgi:hypothetical protein